MRSRWTRPLMALGALALGACAEVRSGPPGGPEDHAPPKLVQVTPDTGRVNTKPKEVVFRFDEVVSERPSGVNTLDALVVLSPSDGVPRVSWHRKAITVRPRKGFRANTAYSVTLLPGIADLRGNVLRAAEQTWFSTGGEIPQTALRGIVFDWVSGKPAPNALVQLFRGNDTTFSWIGTADSTGHFELRAFPSGSYRVRGLIDENHNRVADRREAFDTSGVSIADSGRVELLAFVHDSLGPRIDRLVVEDSITLRLDFDQPYEPTHPVTPTQFTLKRADSTVVPITGFLTDSAPAAEKAAAARARGDTTTPRAVARPNTDSARIAPPNVPAAGGSSVPLPRRGGTGAAPRDTTPPPKPSRPSPTARVIIRLATPLAPGASYRLIATDVWGLSGAPRTSDRVFTVPKPTPPAPVKAPDTGARSAATPPQRP
jgi:hypothetical protein